MTIRIDAGSGNINGAFSDQVRTSGAGAMAAATADLAGSFTQIAGRLKREQQVEQDRIDREADAVWLAKASADARIRWTKDLQDGLTQYDGAAPGFADDFLKRYQADAELQVKAAPERVRAGLQVELLRQGEVFGSSAIAGEAGQRQIWTSATILSTTDAEAEAIVSNPDLWWDSVENVPNLIKGAPASLREKLQSETLEKFASAYAEGQLEKNPERLVEELDKGVLDPSLDPKQKAFWLKTARARIDANTTQARIESERAQRELDTASNDYAGRVVAYYSAGLEPPRDLVKAAMDAARAAGDPGDVERINLARYKRNKEGKEATAASARDAMGLLSDTLKLGMSPSQEMVDSAIAKVRASGKKELAEELAAMGALAGKRQEFAFAAPADLAARRQALMAAPATRETVREMELLNTVEAARDKAISDNNLVGWAASNGVNLMPLQANDPNLADAIAARARTMAVVAREAGASFQLFGKDEAVNFARQLEQLPANDRLQALGVLATELGPDAGMALRQISKTAPVDAQAGLLMATGRKTTAAEIMSGLAAIKATPKLAPNRARPEALSMQAEVIGRALPPELQDQRDALIEAAGAIYAAKAQRYGVDGETFVPDVYKESLQKAAGLDASGKGGFGTVNGSRVLLPPQFNEKEVTALIQSGAVFGRDSYRYSYGDPASGKPGGPPAFRNLKTNELVRFPADQMKNVRLISKGQGLYWVSVTDPAAGPKYVLDLDNGDPFVLDLRLASPGGR